MFNAPNATTSAPSMAAIPKYLRKFAGLKKFRNRLPMLPSPACMGAASVVPNPRNAAPNALVTGERNPPTRPANAWNGVAIRDPMPPMPCCRGR